MDKKDVLTTVGVAGTTLLTASVMGGSQMGCTGNCGKCAFSCMWPVAGIACLAVGGQLAMGKRKLKGNKDEE